MKTSRNRSYVESCARRAGTHAAQKRVNNYENHQEIEVVSAGFSRNVYTGECRRLAVSAFQRRTKCDQACPPARVT